MEGGLDLEKQTSIPVEAELFFLTSLFIELSNAEKGEVKAQACADACYQQAACISNVYTWPQNEEPTR
jgi:hypothetical protein